MFNMNLHILLAKKRMSQKELRELTGISSQTMSCYYNNTFKQINRDHIVKICEVLNCSLDDLFELDNDTKKG
ncbi:helix-turn-helix transcriptional regulator [Clostridium botulinum]|uniref:Helix-turn-helix transcriptional regulator n=1 Tax=Clostridium botulinum TaxID=1491 RepID=A0A6B4JHP4_CLOBO|nr:helix-turn-helix transcriptional regulator [Clostridium botulinum]EES50881.1 conserved domain protein [Clostridium botulinum E1 str. 'BoNT E Beluga']MBY6759754.1 helix-turn-helix transcriptional regulator [Clostridium botulinum]MBY6918663.1 helix-turn-helix transcriptional regulator [Clostridium botulinum]MCR1129749.1 helix-turn-helix transcriptional regulator [Clostridium botulinum]NFJ56470.1 helix-turn-helix transcriptional regulator [Clostridium botulinum]